MRIVETLEHVTQVSTWNKLDTATVPSEMVSFHVHSKTIVDNLTNVKKHRHLTLLHKFITAKPISIKYK